ncbi:hypothetical protein CWC05_10640 [Pseudoalteromonas ruthenica]|uniref:RelA/SpoT domain-containing protein n=1 Tax=Pseudoalteromonas ruthenica TaxID=151081 RepID=A0A5S3Z5Y0_9GAMM|nr:hypothetical protein [Pseudoalteromonas ruthenica]TMP86926.1 hypothetical protein CWC05_10640 [Pseudoalteromonas ruthenica]
MEREKLLEEYESNIDLFRELATSMDSLVNILLSSSAIKPHSVTCRVKERSSLAKKIDKKDKYQDISEVTDIVGLRIISNYSDEVDEIAKIIESEFCIDSSNSIDKRAALDPDRFGYLSLHYVVSLKPERSCLVEYRRFKEIKFEIQIRSILQHTWAEIEHDIGYKSKIEVPKPIRRKFSRLAGLLELADDQFVQIRDDLNEYEKTVQTTIKTTPEKIGIDTISIYEYANNSGVVKEIDMDVAKLANLKLKPLDKDDASRHVKYLQFFGVESISDLENELSKNKEYILKRAQDIEGDNQTVSSGISIFYLHQILAAKTLDRTEILGFLNKMSLSLEEDRESFAEYLSNLI